MSILLQAAEAADWQQVVLNGGPPCFHVYAESFCLRAERWPGHPQDHPFVSLAEMLATAEARGGALAVEQVRRMAEEVAAAEAPVEGDEGIMSAGFGLGWRGGLRRFLEALPTSPDLAEELRRIEERGRLKWIPLAVEPPRRDPERAEQSILTWDERSATFGLIAFEAQEEPEAVEWIGLTHWCDITGLCPAADLIEGGAET